MGIADVFPGPSRSAQTGEASHQPGDAARPGDDHDRPAPRDGRLFVGREPQLDELVSALHDAGSGRGRLFVLVGEPGIGKTRTVGELASRAGPLGVDAYWGRCYEAGGAPAFWPWVQALRGVVRDMSSAELVAHLGPAGADVAILLPELRDRIPDLAPAAASSESEHARFRLFDAVCTFIANAARAKPLALLLDDMHAADEASLLLLQFVAKLIHELPVVVVATFRDVDLGRQHPVSRALADLEREPSCSRLFLQRLTASEVGRFIEASCGAPAARELVETVMESTEGNPFFVVEVVRLLLSEGKLREGAEHDPLTIAVPRGVRDVVGRRLDILSDAANHALDAASVIGREFTTPILERLVDMSRAELLDALEEARAARVIDELTEPGAYRFSHALIRDALYEELTAIRRLRLHRQAGEAFEELSAANLEPRLAEIAFHFLATASDGGAERAVSYARRAGDHAMAVLAYEEAARVYAQALDALEFMYAPQEAEKGEILVSLGDARAASGDGDGARDAYLRATALARRIGSPTLLARAALGFAGSWTSYDRDVRDVELLREALASVAGSDDALRSRLLARIATDPDFPPSAERRAMAEEAVAVARTANDVAALAFALKAFHGVIDSPEATEECLAVATEMVSLAEAVGDKEMALHGRTLRASNLLILGETRAAEREMDAHGLLATELRQPLHQWLQTLFQACRALSDGRFAEAEGLSEKALEIGLGAQAADVPEHYAIQLMVLRREVGGLEDLVTVARQWVDERPQVPAWRAALAALLCEVDRHSEARRELERLTPIADALPWDGNWLCGMATFSWACAAVSDAQRARVAYDLLLPFGDRIVIGATVAISFGPVSHYLGILAATLGQPADAARHFEHALRANVRTGSRPWLAWTQYEYARLLLGSDEREQRERGRELLGDCARTTDELGMTRLSALAEALRGQTPTTDRNGAVRGALTARELEVLRLVARGLSNREIARELSASEKTVRNHVSSVLAKIHVADRTQAALYAVREGLADLGARST